MQQYGMQKIINGKLKRAKFLNETPLVFYHFANVCQIDRYLFNTNLSRVLVSLNGVLKNNVYKVF